MYITAYVSYVYMMPSITELQQTDVQLGVLPAASLSYTVIYVYQLLTFYGRITHMCTLIDASI